MPLLPEGGVRPVRRMDDVSRRKYFSFTSDDGMVAAEERNEEGDGRGGGKLSRRRGKQAELARSSGVTLPRKCSMSDESG